VHAGTCQNDFEDVCANSCPASPADTLEDIPIDENDSTGSRLLLSSYDAIASSTLTDNSPGTEVLLGPIDVSQPGGHVQDLSGTRYIHALFNSPLFSFFVIHLNPIYYTDKGRDSGIQQSKRIESAEKGNGKLGWVMKGARKHTPCHDKTAQNEVLAGKLLSWLDHQRVTNSVQHAPERY
jgi:hypothetical protein